MTFTARLARMWRANEFTAVIIATLALLSFLVGAASLFVDTLFVVRPGDAPKYLQLARAPLSPGTAPSAPFKFRALTPFFVWLLPTNPVAGFAIVTLSALAATGVTLHYYLRDFGFGPRRAFAGVVLFVISPAIAYLTTNVVLVDALAYLFLVGALWAAARDDVLLFALTLAVGVAAKEIVLFALPVYVLYRLQRGGLRGTGRALVAGVPAGAMLVALRLFYGVSNDTLAAIVERGVEAQLDKLALSVFYIPYEVYSAFGTLWVLALLAAWRTDDDFLRAGLLVAPLAFLQPLVARDIARVLFVVFPVVIPAALAAIGELEHRETVALVAFALAAAAAGTIGALFVLPALAGNVASVSLPALQFLALVGAANELLIVGVLLDARRSTHAETAASTT